MIFFSDTSLSIAAAEDAASIAALLNEAYRGESSRQGWTTEAGLISGDTRATVAMVTEVINQAGSVFVVYRRQDMLAACVNLQQHGQKIYLGMFSVSPKLQGSGIGKILLQAAEVYALSVNCSSIYMSVISLRTELIDWYKRQGYADTGERKPFAEDGITGKHLVPLEFAILEKQLS